jgi:hypothetical protein
MIKLFVDDNRKEPEGWYRARTVTEAIRVLSTMHVDEISLDHDIECYDLIRGSSHTSEETFFAVAHFLYMMPESIRPKIRIHTGNIAKGREMADLLGVEYNNEIFNEKNYV